MKKGIIFVGIFVSAALFIALPIISMKKISNIEDLLDESDGDSSDKASREMADVARKLHEIEKKEVSEVIAEGKEEAAIEDTANQSKEEPMTFWQRIKKQLNIVGTVANLLGKIFNVVKKIPIDAKSMQNNLNKIKEGKKSLSTDVRSMVPEAGLGFAGGNVVLKKASTGSLSNDDKIAWTIVYNNMGVAYVSNFLEKSIMPFSKELVKSFGILKTFITSFKPYAQLVEQILEIFFGAITELNKASQENIRLGLEQLGVKKAELITEEK